MEFLKDELLDAVRLRAPGYDRDNAFPAQDVADLREAGYLRAFVPEEFGGAGLTLAQVAEEQSRLAGAAPATALAVNMHQIIVGLGRALVRSGNEAGEQILYDAAAGRLHAFGISEPGNDLVLFGSLTEARPDDSGGYAFYGTKVFTSMAPAWERLLVFGRDESGEGGPHSVFALLRREDGGFRVREDWDTLGMRATQSNTTDLEGAHAPAAQVLGRVPAGPSMEPVVFGIFSNFEVLLGATYLGIGQRAVAVAAAQVRTRRSVRSATTYANDPDIRWRLADAAIGLAGARTQVLALARDLDQGIDHGALWMSELSAAKNAAAEAGLRAVEQALRSSGGASYFQGNELSRLYRDVVAGLFQPSDQESLHAAWANVVLGPIER